MKTVFFDIDTQLDFVSPAGALYAPGAEAIVGKVAALNQFAARNGLPLVSTMDAHAENDPEFHAWPPHCVRGTLGQRKPAATLLEPAVIIPPETAEISIDGAAQILLEKRALDCFSNPNLPALLDRLAAGRCVVYGVVTELCVRCAALGLLAAGRRVELVRDAIQALSEEARERTFREVQEAGGTLTAAHSVMGTR